MIDQGQALVSRGEPTQGGTYFGVRVMRYRSMVIDIQLAITCTQELFINIATGVESGLFQARKINNTASATSVEFGLDVSLK